MYSSFFLYVHNNNNKKCPIQFIVALFPTGQWIMHLCFDVSFNILKDMERYIKTLMWQLHTLPGFFCGFLEPNIPLFPCLSTNIMKGKTYYISALPKTNCVLLFSKVPQVSADMPL